MKDVIAAAEPLGLQIEVLNASNSDEIDTAFKTLMSGRADGLLVGPDAFFVSRRVQIDNPSSAPHGSRDICLSKLGCRVRRCRRAQGANLALWHPVTSLTAPDHFAVLVS